MNSVRHFFLLLLTISFLAACDQADNQPYRTWEVYKGGPEANNYSSLDQIDKSNVNQLEVAWTFYPQDEPEGFQFWKYECNPIIIGDTMYVTSAWRWLYALNAVTGEKLWTFDPMQGQRGGGALRGVTYWEGDGEKRVFVNARSRLFAVDAHTGQAIPTFGDQGSISLDLDPALEAPSVTVRLSTPGIIYKDLIIIGAAVSEAAGGAPGPVRAYNVRTGELVWTFNTVPRPGEFGYETWPEDAYKYIGGANNWAGMSLDKERGIIYVPTGSPTYDYYGGDRVGANLFGNTLIALEAATGKRVWHYQTVHHDIWDYDLPTAPNLVTITRDGQKIDAVAQPTKMGFLYILDRETGEPIYPVEERPMPPSKLPGEQAWPTQPFPLKPAPFSRQGIPEKEIAKFSDEAYNYNQQTLSKLWHEGIFTPTDPGGTLLIPGSRGGAEWGGGAYDMETGVLYINSNESPEVGRTERVRNSTDDQEVTLFEAGRQIYLTYCASCHGADRKGIEANPSLVDVDQRLSREAILERVSNGSGIMPGFSRLVQGHEEEILAFLSNSGKQQQVEATAEADTSTSFLNVTAHGYMLDHQGMPVIKPPWGTLNAIDLNTGEFLWRIPLGNDERYHQPGDPPTGMENYGGPAVTAGGLVFIAATMDSRFRAFDKDTGEMLWEYELPGNGLANPAVYEINGRQYVAIAVSIGENLQHHQSAVMAFALPK